MRALKIAPELIFQALSEPIRLRILYLLVVSGGEACLCDLSESLWEPDYKLSRHVKILRGAGLLTSEKEGRWIYHKAIKNSNQLKPLYRFVKNILDQDLLFSVDLKRYRQIISQRDQSRCKSTQTTKKRTDKPI